MNTPKLSYPPMEETLDSIRTKLEVIITQEQQKAESVDDNPGSPYVQKLIYDTLYENISPTEIKNFKDNFYSMTLRRDEILQRTVEDSVKLIKDDWCKKSNLLTAHFIQTSARDKMVRSINGKLTYDVKTRIVPVTDYYNEKHIDDAINKNPEEYVPEFIRPNGRRAEMDEVELTSVSNITGLYDPRSKTKINEVRDIMLISLFSRIKLSDREKAKAADWVAGLRVWEDYPYDGMGEIAVFPDEGIGQMSCPELMYKYLDYITQEKFSNHKIRMLKNTMTLNEFKNNKDETLLKLTEKYSKENYNKIMRLIPQWDKELYSLKKIHELSKINDLVRLDKKKEERIIKLKDAMLQGKQAKGYIDGERAEIWIMNQTMHRAYTGPHIGHTAEHIYARDMFRRLYLHNPALSDALKKLYEGKKNPEEPSRAIIVDMIVKGIFNEMFTITPIMRKAYDDMQQHNQSNYNH